MLKTALGRLRGVALCEGISYLLLLGVAMPLKYMFDTPEAVRIVGMAHGILFVMLVVTLLNAHHKRGWGVTFSSMIFISSLMPFGAFWMDRRLKALEAETVDGPTLPDE